MIRSEITARCDACDNVVVSGPPEREAEVLAEFRKDTALVVVGGHSVRVCADCVSSGVFSDEHGNHPRLDRDKPLPIERAFIGSRFPRHPRRNGKRLQDNVVDGEVVDETERCTADDRMAWGVVDCPIHGVHNV